MNIGIGLPNTVAGATRADILDWARRADDGPFASLAVFDRLIYPSLDPLVTLAAVAGCTERVRLAATVMIGPIRNNALLAKQAASLNALSGGRLTLGVGLGARADDYAATGSEYAGRGRRLDDQLRALRDLWEDKTLNPGPTPHGRPELLVGGVDDHAYARSARSCDGYIHGGGPPRAFASSANRARAAWAEAGRPRRPLLWGMAYFAFGDDAQAGKDYLLDYYAFTGPFAERIAAGLLTTPQSVVQLARGYAEAGCDHLVIFPTSTKIEQLDRLADAIA
jgi:alkanesulfonate monooxygenase SsuD/methylene tetrahydromethanopterin reductase-like flavin-dependent oxidoreductase (luciferase family)